MREARQPHRGMAVWLTGYSGSGKSTLAHAVEERLFSLGYNIIVLDGDAVRTGLCKDLGFSQQDRLENIRRIAETAKLFIRNGTLCICAFISPNEGVRIEARKIIGDEFFREVYIKCTIEECERRDIKGFYKKARKGEIQDYTGISAAYEAPLSPDCTICTENTPVEVSVQQLFHFVYSVSKQK